MPAIVSSKIRLDPNAQTDMLIVQRGTLVFCWSSGDEVVHVWDTHADRQHPRMIDVEEPWDIDHLEALADMYLSEDLELKGS